MDQKYQNLYYVCDLEKYSVEHKESLSNCREILRETKTLVGTNILRTLGLWFPTVFFSK